MNSYIVTSLVLASLMMISLTTVSGQTFQYSRGWTNGKRNGMGNGNGMYELNIIDRLLSNPCQLEKLRYILQGKPLNEKLMVPCDLMSMSSSEVDSEPSSMRLKRSPQDFAPRMQDDRQNYV